MCMWADGFNIFCSVADPWCLSRIRLFSIPDPNCLHPGSASKMLTFSPSRIQGSKRHRIPDPDPQLWFFGCLFVEKKIWYKAAVCVYKITVKKQNSFLNPPSESFLRLLDTLFGLKVCTKAACDPKNCLESRLTWGWHVHLGGFFLHPNKGWTLTPL